MRRRGARRRPAAAAAADAGLAFAIRHLRRAAGVMVTATHNPPQDNGYKVYLGDGSQIVPPADAGSPQRSTRSAALADVPRGDGLDGPRRRASSRRYLAAVVAAAVRPVAARAVDGLHPAARRRRATVSERCCSARVSRRARVPAQAEPDPDFPTVAFPNPEEPGAHGSRAGARGATSAPTSWSPTTPTPTAAPSRSPGPRRLADAARRRGRRAARRPPAATRASRARTPPSIVSSPCSRGSRPTHGVPYVETLTGFKWIGRVPDLAFGYEEALGYCVDPARVRDKDGVSARAAGRRARRRA